MERQRRTARRHLDERLRLFQPLTQQPVPYGGWIKAIRTALGMSTADMATRMGLSQQRVSVLEEAERTGGIKLESLERAARALDCDLVYAFVPRTSLEEAVRAQALRKAADHMGWVTHTMRLEDAEAFGADDVVNDLADDLIDRRGLWSDVQR